jgi:hypothetical protein
MFLVGVALGFIVALTLKVDFKLSQVVPPKRGLSIEVLELVDKQWKTALMSVDRDNVQQLLRKIKVKDEDDLYQLYVVEKDEVVTVEKTTWDLFK